MTRRPADHHCWRCGALGTPPPAACPRCGNAEPAPPPGRHLGLKDALAGLTSPLRGLRFLNATPRLWSWIVIPLAVDVLLFAATIWFLVTTGYSYVPDMSEPWPAWIDWLRVGVGWLVEALLWTVVVVVARYTTLVLAGIVNAPFYDKLSEVVEAVALGSKDPGRPWSALLGDAARSIGAAVSMALRQLMVTVSLALLLLVPPLAAVLGWIPTVLAHYYQGLGQVDVVLSRKLYRGSRRASWGRRHWLMVTAMGVPLLLIPFTAPFGIVGATLAFLDDPDKS